MSSGQDGHPGNYVNYPGSWILSRWQLAMMNNQGDIVWVIHYRGWRMGGDGMKWKWFLHYWPFVKGIHQSLFIGGGGWEVTSWNGNDFCITGPLWRESTSHQWIPFTITKGQWCSPFLFMLAWTSCWTNTWVASDLRYHDPHMTL